MTSRNCKSRPFRLDFGRIFERRGNCAPGTCVVIPTSVNLRVKHIKPLQLISAAFVFLASSGATIVVRQCSMDTASCCNTASCDNDDACDQPVALPSDHSIKAEYSCRTTTLVGGLAIQQAVVEQPHKSLLIMAVLGLVVPPDCRLSAQPPRSSSALLLADAASPPSVEKYVLNASFLI